MLISSYSFISYLYKKMIRFLLWGMLWIHRAQESLLPWGSLWLTPKSQLIPPNVKEIGLPGVSGRETRKQVVVYSKCYLTEMGIMLRKPRRRGVIFHCPPSACVGSGQRPCRSFCPSSSLASSFLKSAVHTATIAALLQSTCDHLTPVLPVFLGSLSLKEWWWQT